MLRLRVLNERLRESLWFLPALIVLGFVVLAAALVALDHAVVGGGDEIGLYGGSPEGARTILATIATAMLSLAVLVFSITLVVLQLASSQLTARVVSLFLQERWTKVAMGVFLGTFAYALVGLWFVRSVSQTEQAFVPVSMMTVAYLAVGASLLIFLSYIHRVAQSIRVETVVHRIAAQVLKAVDATLITPEEQAEAAAESDAGEAFGAAGAGAGGGARAGGDRPAAAAGGPSAATGAGVPGAAHEGGASGPLVEGGPPALEIPAPRSATVVGLSPDVAVEWARSHDSIVVVTAPLGLFVSEGTPLVRVFGRPGDARFPLAEVVSLGHERTVKLDPTYGVRQLVNIALRALSPGVNEADTAVVVLDHLHEILLRVGDSLLPGPEYRDDEGTLRAVVPRLTWDGWVGLALREIVDDGGGSANVCHRLLRLLDDLVVSLPTHRRPVLRRFAEEVRGLSGSGGAYAQWDGLEATERPGEAP